MRRRTAQGGGCVPKGPANGKPWVANETPNGAHHQARPSTQWGSDANSAKRASHSGPPKTAMSRSAWLTGRAGLRPQQRRHRPSPFLRLSAPQQCKAGAQGRSWPPAGPARAARRAYIARPAAGGARRFCRCRFVMAPARPATDAGLETQPVATVSTSARAAHTTASGGVEE